MLLYVDGGELNEMKRVNKNYLICIIQVSPGGIYLLVNRSNFSIIRQNEREDGGERGEQERGMKDVCV